jgi:hypothetical protein
VGKYLVGFLFGIDFVVVIGGVAAFCFALWRTTAAKSPQKQRGYSTWLLKFCIYSEGQGSYLICQSSSTLLLYIANFRSLTKLTT